MSELKIKGTINKVLEVQKGETKDGKEWQKVEFIVHTDSEYNNKYCFEIFGAEKVDKFLQYNKEGDLVDVDFNVNLNEWKDKYYTSLSAWKVWKDKGESAPSQEPISDDSSNVLPF